MKRLKEELKLLLKKSQGYSKPLLKYTIKVVFTAAIATSVFTLLVGKLPLVFIVGV